MYDVSLTYSALQFENIRLCGVVVAFPCFFTQAKNSLSKEKVLGMAFLRFLYGYDAGGCS